MSLIEDSLDKARINLVQAYNAAKNDLPDSTSNIARMLADVSSELQYIQEREVRAEKGLDTEYE
jgi:hypothetical protein